MAIVSNYKNKKIDPKTVFIGELGLTGEIRSINNFEKRVKEIEKMGYSKIYASKRQVDMLKESIKDTEIGLTE
jgi:DNA repair protein RadA/Sms